jgi:GWxTD domain-containing protein
MERTRNVQLLTAIVAFTALSGAPVGPPAGQATVEVVAKRFLRGEATLIDGFCRVPFDLLTVVPAAGAAREGVYRLEVLVRDSTGLLLHESGWSQTVSGEFLEIAGASTVEHFSFTVPDGRYTLVVSVTDSASGAVRRASHELHAIPDDERVSDLLLSAEIRRATDAGVTPGPGEIQKGALFIGVATLPVLTPHESELFYYLELYPGAEASIELTPTIATATGQVITSGAPEVFAVGAAGGVAARSLSLAGLPEGEYVLRMAVALPDGQVTREAAFRMGGFETEAQIAQVAAAPPADPFAELTEARLDSLYGPLEYLMESDERNVYPNLSVEGKRNYLRQFWEKRDPTPGTPVNEAMLVYYRQFAEANRRFRESGAGDIPGWRTDRGRIFLKYGEAEETLRRPVSGDAPPYEVWKYTRPRQLKFVFLDQTGLGNYQLIYTNDRFEASRADWETLLGPRAVEDVLRF